MQLYVLEKDKVICISRNKGPIKHNLCLYLASIDYDVNQIYYMTVVLVPFFQFH